jgi:hypothetical protein
MRATRTPALTAPLTALETSSCLKGTRAVIFVQKNPNRELRFMRHLLSGQGRSRPNNSWKNWKKNAVG